MQIFEFTPKSIVRQMPLISIERSVLGSWERKSLNQWWLFWSVLAVLGRAFFSIKKRKALVVSPTAVSYVRFDYMGAIFFEQWFCPCGPCHHQKVFQTIIWLLLSRLQCNKPHRNSPEPSEPCLRYLYQHTPELSGPPEPSGACLRNIHQHAPELSGTFQNSGTLGNLPEPASGTYTSTHRNAPEPSANLPEPSGPSRTCLRNLHQHTPELAGTLWNLPRNLHAAAQTGTLRNFPEPASEATPAHRNFPEPSEPLHQRTSELSGTFRNLPPQPTPAHTGTFGEPSGTCPRNLHHTTEPSGTVGNLPPEPAPATRTGTHRSLSGLKTPLAYAVGEKLWEMPRFIIPALFLVWSVFLASLPFLFRRI